MMLTVTIIHSNHIVIIILVIIAVLAVVGDDINGHDTVSIIIATYPFSGPLLSASS